MQKNRSSGFTILELLIAITLIGIIATLVLTNFQNSQADARISKAESELQLIEKAVVAMEIDVAKWPNGCVWNAASDPEADITSASAGLTHAPPVGYIDTDCEWTNIDLIRWNGPYLQDPSIIDPWENDYIFDPDYYPWQGCSSKTTLPVIPAVVTYGPDETRYTCDDIYREIGE